MAALRPALLLDLTLGLDGLSRRPPVLRPHLSTFVCGSLTVILYVKIDAASHAFEFSRLFVFGVRALEVVMIGLLLSVCYRGLFFH